MAANIAQGFARIVQSRDRMLEVRTARFDALQRFRTYAKERLSDFVSTTDPVTGQRLADVSAGGEKARGEMAMMLAFFEGSKLRFDVDATAQFSISANPPELISHIGRLVDLVVPEDCSRAILVYEAVGDASKERRTLDAEHLIAKLVDYAVAACDEQLGDAGPPQPVAVPPRTAPATAQFSAQPPPAGTPARPAAPVQPEAPAPPAASPAFALEPQPEVTSRSGLTPDAKPVFSFSIG